MIIFTYMTVTTVQKVGKDLFEIIITLQSTKSYDSFNT